MVRGDVRNRFVPCGPAADESSTDKPTATLVCKQDYKPYTQSNACQPLRRISETVEFHAALFHQA